MPKFKICANPKCRHQFQVSAKQPNLKLCHKCRKLVKDWSYGNAYHITAFKGQNTDAEVLRGRDKEEKFHDYEMRDFPVSEKSKTKKRKEGKEDAALYALCETSDLQEAMCQGGAMGGPGHEEVST